MKKLLRALSVLLVLMCIGAKAYSGSIWDQFLLSPREDAFRKLNTVVSNKPEHCNHETQPSDAQTAQLLKLVQKGNQSALRAAILISQCLGVGDLEDFYRSAGIFFEVRPRTFLQIAKEHAIPDREFGYMITMLPLALVDDLDGQISAVNKRIAVLGRISDASLVEIKKTALAFLRKGRGDLEKAKADAVSDKGYSSNGSDERDMAQAYYERVGYPHWNK